MAHSLSFLLSSEAATMRMSERQPTFVIHVEIDSDMSFDNRFIELDADSLEQADNIADVWVNKMGKVSAAIRRVMPDGTLRHACSIVC